MTKFMYTHLDKLQEFKKPKEWIGKILQLASFMLCEYLVENLSADLENSKCTWKICYVVLRHGQSLQVG